MSKYTGNQYRNTSFRNGGRKAGIGTLYDDYGDESGYSGQRFGTVKCRFPNDDKKPEELNGECIIVQKGKKKNDSEGKTDSDSESADSSAP